MWARSKSFARNKTTDIAQHYSIHFVSLRLVHTHLVHLQMVVLSTQTRPVIHKTIQDVRSASFTISQYLDPHTILSRVDLDKYLKPFKKIKLVEGPF